MCIKCKVERRFNLKPDYFVLKTLQLRSKKRQENGVVTMTIIPRLVVIQPEFRKHLVVRDVV